MSAAGRPRRSCLAVPGSSPRMLARARDLPSDQVFLDLEDAVAPAAKPAARSAVVAALTRGGWGDRIRAVRVNDVTTPWAYRDVIEVVEGAGAHLDCLILPKVGSPADVRWLDILLTQIERAVGLPEGGIGIEAQIEDARGLLAVEEIAGCSSRLEALVFGPADLMASLHMRSFTVGRLHPDYPGDIYHHILVRLLLAARAHGLQAVDGPYPTIWDLDGLAASARRSAALGFDGKWVLHPGQIDTCNEIYSPGQEEYDHAELILETYAHHTSEAQGARGAVMLGGEMIDEASRKMALVVAAKGRAAGMVRTPGSGSAGH